MKVLAGKLFKGNHHLNDAFLALIPQAFYPDTLLPQPETISISPEPTDEAAVTSSEASPNEKDGVHFERIDLGTLGDDYGGDNCSCGCHVKKREAGEDLIHCIHCSIVVSLMHPRFI